jgi:hypothetical protein
VYLSIFTLTGTITVPPTLMLGSRNGCVGLCFMVDFIVAIVVLAVLESSGRR